MKTNIPTVNRTVNSIQFLRFFASLLVLVTHSTFYTHERYSDAMTVFKPGAVGVDIFFVISGFVILLSSITKSGEFRGGLDFTVKRLTRIVPMYWIATSIKVAALILSPALVLHAAFDPSRIILSYFFLPSVSPDGRWEPILGVGWTLVFEMFFYFIFAMSLFAKRNPIVISSFIIISFSAISTLRADSWPVWTMYFDRIMLYFVIGMMCYIIMMMCSKTTLRAITATLVTVSIIFIARKIVLDEEIITRLSFETFTFVVTLFFVVVQCEPVFTGSVSKLFSLLGDASYSTYLFHPIVAPLVPTVFKKLSSHGITVNPFIVVISTIIFALIVTVIIHLVIEKPITNKIRSIVSKRKLAVTA
ncbi:acyltransferase family protein [Serratia fonticola]